MPHTFKNMDLASYPAKQKAHIFLNYRFICYICLQIDILPYISKYLKISAGQWLINHEHALY